MQLSVVIPTMKGRSYLLSKLLSTIPPGYEKIIVDDEDLLLAAKRNKGALKSLGDYILFVDDDNHLEPEAIEKAVIFLETSYNVGIIGFMACYDDQRDLIADGGSMRNHLTGFTFGVNTNKSWSALPKVPYEVDEIANCFMIHSELFFELHGFDQKNFPIDLDEADLCKRVKDLGKKVMMLPFAKCYHNSQTYSPIPNFRRPMNAYFMGRNRILYSRKHYHGLRGWCHLALFVPVFVCFYSASLLYKKNPGMIGPFLKGVFDGLRGCRENKYQKK